jgi:hypothetical protein
MLEYWSDGETCTTEPVLQYSSTPILQDSGWMPMLKFRESMVSAHHNYLVNQMLTPGFALGNPSSDDEFFFVGDVLTPPESKPRLCGRLFDESGVFVLRFAGEEIVENPGGCVRQKLVGGFRILYASGEPLLSVRTESYANGYLTRIQGKLYDRDGKIRMEPVYDSIRVFGEKTFCLSSPLLSKSPV